MQLLSDRQRAAALRQPRRAVPRSASSNSTRCTFRPSGCVTKQYTAEALITAVELKGQFSVRRIAELTGVPRATISDHHRVQMGKADAGGAPATSTQQVLSVAQESALMRHVQLMAERLESLSKEDILMEAFKLAKSKPPTNGRALEAFRCWEKKEKASEKWWVGFKQRHPELSLCTPNLMEAKDENRRTTKYKLDSAGMIRTLALPLKKHNGACAWELGNSPLNVRAGFRKAGLYPFNPSVYAKLGCDTRGVVEAPPITSMDTLCTAAIDAAAAEEEAALALLEVGHRVAKKARPLPASAFAQLPTASEFLEAQLQREADARAELAAKAERRQQREAGAAAKRAAEEAKRAARSEQNSKKRKIASQPRMAQPPATATPQPAPSKAEAAANRAAALQRWRAKRGGGVRVEGNGQE